MKRRAFTLVELMVVMSILILLVLLLMPSLRVARRMAKANVCQTNLHNIEVGFTTAYSQADQRSVHFSYDPNQWPGVPSTILNNPMALVCPEADAVEAGGTGQVAGTPDASNAGGDLATSDPIAGLRYVNKARGIDMPFANCGGPAAFFLGMSRNSSGGYSEYYTNDNSSYVIESDGHDGVIRITDSVGGSGRKAVLMEYDCGEYNCVLYAGKPLFPDPAQTNSKDPTYGWLGPGRSKVGSSVNLTTGECSGWAGSDGTKVGVVPGVPPAPCSYGMNASAADVKYGDSKILVLDFDTYLVDPTTNISDALDTASLRHPSKLNVLFADGSIQPRGPTMIDPVIFPGLWK